ncbi:MAG: polysaccharide biosynthesis tyrosine autokinase [Nostocaceae cyanobacterium]|nr:polysaccharide biosynthesis tyrosine autokinase [Nostocaceae cyanobacterium]
MKNSLHQLSSPERNGNGHHTPTILQTQPFPWSESQTEDWNVREFLHFARRRALVIIGVAAVVMAGATGLTLTQQAEYQGSFRLLVEPVSNDDNALPNLTAGIGSNISKPGLDYETQIQVLKSPEIMRDIVKQLQISYPDITYGSLVNNLTINRLGQTKLIEFRYRSQDPAKIKVVLDELADSYLKYSLDKRQTKLRQGMQFVDKQLPGIKNRVGQLQKQLEIFRKQNGFIDPSTKTEQIAEQAKTLAEQRLVVDRQLAQTRANFASLQEEQGALSVLNDASVYQSLVLKVRDLEAQIAGESTRFLENSPAMENLREKREKLLPILRQEARRILGLKLAEVAAQIRTLEVNSQELARAEQALQKEFQQLPILARKYTELQQQLNVATESLNRFLTTRQNLQIEVAQTELPWQLVQAPTQPQSPISPNTQRNLILGLVASTLIGVGSGLLLEKLDNTYHSLDDIKEKLKLPLVGTIPFDKQLSKIKNNNSQAKTSLTRVPSRSSQTVPGLMTLEQSESISDQEYSFYQSPSFLEAFRILYTNIQLLSSDSPIRSFVITSAMPGDGKSTIAFYLAQIVAAMGQRVLLVDADLRKPQVHALSKINNLWGLSSLISTNMEKEQVIHQLSTMGKLSVLPAGPTPPDPTKLLSSDKMRRLMADLDAEYDLVIYDAPPLLGLADASLLAPKTDGVMLVARMDKTDRSALKQTVERLKLSRANILGTIVNGHRSKLNDYYQKYYYYDAESK